MFNLYESLKSFPPFSRQLMCKGMLFTNYDCPQLDCKMSFYIEHNFIIYVLSGRRIYHRQQQTWEMKDGTCAFVRKGGLVAERPPGESWCVMAFFVPDEFLLKVANENQQASPTGQILSDNGEPVILLDTSEISKYCIYSMLPYFSQQPAPPENLVELKFKELVLSLMVNPANMPFLAYLDGLDKDGRVSLPQLMQNNFCFNLSLAEYAKMSCRSVSSFKRAFKKHFNESPARWILKKRIDTAQKLLRKSSLAVADVSMECGFENPSHFSRVFKEHIGESPLQFRQRLQLQPL